MAITRRLLTNFSKGKLDRLIEGRPDLAAYFEGGSEITNFLLLRQGGLIRRPGLRFIAEVKDSTKDTVLLPFEASVNDAIIIELGDLYARFIKNKVQIRVSAGAPPYEIVSAYAVGLIRDVHYTQSVDVMFTFQATTPQQRLSRFSDVNWTMVATTYVPPPSFEADTDISAGATLTPGATTGTGVIFTASAARFLEGDVGRQIIFGASRGTIVAFGSSAADVASPNDQVRVDIIDAFPNTSPIASGSWLLRLSPQATLDPNIKEPVGGFVNLVASKNSFRAADVGKFIVIYGGLIRITQFISVTFVIGEILSILAGSSLADPAASAAGAWSLEISSWSVTNGFPRTGEFYQGRLGQASTAAEPTAFWLSASDSFDNYAIGISADRAIVYTIASRALNRIEWMADNIDLFMGTSGSEFRIRGAKPDEPLGGDQIPLPQRIDSIGSSSIQPVVVGRRVIMVDRSGKKVYAIAFDIEEDGFGLYELTGASDSIMGTGVRQGQLAYAKRPDPRIYFVCKDGRLVTLTYHQREKVIGFTELTTDGTFEAVAAIPQTGGLPDQVFVITRRNINGTFRRYIELFDTETIELISRPWTMPQTDCCKMYNLAGVPTTVLTGLSHLEGKTVDVITDNSHRGTKVVSSGQITLTESASQNAEVGLHYRSFGTTMRPAIEGQMVEGLPRAWIKLWMRLDQSIGGKVQGSDIMYPPALLNTNPLRTGDVEVTPMSDWDTTGKITFEQNQPYPMTVLAIFGDIEFGDHG